MIQALKAEFKKILTVRSTYVIMALCLAVVIFFAFYIEGFHRATDVTDSGLLASEVTSAVSALALPIALIGLMLMTHEYRYNTIAYTLTATRSRLKVLLAKFIAVSVVTLVLLSVFCALAPLMTYLGVSLKGLDMVAQSLPAWDLVWRTLFYGWGYAMLALLIATLVRSQVGSIAVLFLFPAMVESLLGLLLKSNTVYLPFNALNSVVQDTTLSHEKAALVFLGYLAAGWAVAAVLFLRRDAN